MTDPKAKRPRAAVVINPDDLESLEETVEVLSDSAAMRRLRKAQAEVESGEVVDEQQLTELMAARRRRADT